MFFRVHKRVNDVLLCTQLDFLCIQEYIMECCFSCGSSESVLCMFWIFSLHLILISVKSFKTDTKLTKVHHN